MHADQRLRPRERLTRRADFDRAFAQGARAANPLLTVHVVQNELGWSRLGLVTSKKVGNAPQRNYVRRRIREAFRRQRPQLPAGVDIVCVARAAAASRDADVAAALLQLTLAANKRLRKATSARSDHPGRTE